MRTVLVPVLSAAAASRFFASWKASQRRWDVWCRNAVWGGFSLFGCVALLNLGAGIESFNFLNAFDRDEGLSGTMLVRALSEHSLDPHGFYNYGFSYIAAPYGVVRALDTLGYQPSERLVIYAGRATSFAAYGLTLAAGYAGMRGARVPRTLAAAGIAVLGSAGSLFLHSLIFRPDVPQAAFVALALVALCRPSAVLFLLSAALAGVAFGLKYSGGFALVAIATSLATGEISRRPGWGKSRFRRLGVAVAIPVVFAAAWIATNPTVPSNHRAFLEDVQFERAHVERGHNSNEPRKPSLWLTVLADDVTPPVLVAWAAGMLSLVVLAGRAAVRRSKVSRWSHLRRLLSSPRRRFLIALAVYLGVGFAFLLLEVNMRRSRFLLHLIPAAAILGTAGLAHWVRLLPDKARLAVHAGACLCALAALTHAAKAARGIANRDHDERVPVGAWVAEHHGPGTRVLADWYTYLPPHLRRVTLVDAARRSRITRVNPEVVIFNRYATGRRCWKRAGTAFSELSLECRPYDGTPDVRRTLLWLGSPASSYKVEYETDAFVVLARATGGTPR